LAMSKFLQPNIYTPAFTHAHDKKRKKRNVRLIVGITVSVPWCCQQC
jgi:hypothetical protein